MTTAKYGNRRLWDRHTVHQRFSAARLILR